MFLDLLNWGSIHPVVSKHFKHEVFEFWRKVIILWVFPSYFQDGGGWLLLYFISSKAREDELVQGLKNGKKLFDDEPDRLNDKVQDCENDLKWERDFVKKLNPNSKG